MFRSVYEDNNHLVARFSKGYDEKKEEKLFRDENGSDESVFLVQVVGRNHGPEKSDDPLLSVVAEDFLLLLHLEKIRQTRYN